MFLGVKGEKGEGELIRPTDAMSTGAKDKEDSRAFISGSPAHGRASRSLCLSSHKN